MLNIRAEYKGYPSQEQTQSKFVTILEFFVTEIRGAQFLAVTDDGDFIIAPISRFKGINEHPIEIL